MAVQATNKTNSKKRMSEYGKRLAAKQFARNEYGLREKQFRKYFEQARKVRGTTGNKLLELLERRLDNVVYRLDLCQTRRQARQWVSHGHILVNGKKVTIPSFQVNVNDVVELKNDKITSPRGVEIPAWLKINDNKLGGAITAYPSREDASPEIEEQMIIEFYSR